MFFTTDDKVNVVQFGSGDIEVSGSLLDEPTETIGCLALIPRTPGEIGKSVPKREECVLDTMIGVHTRLTFTDIRSIDVIIDQLKIVKQCMEKD